MSRPGRILATLVLGAILAPLVAGCSGAAPSAPASKSPARTVAVATATASPTVFAPAFSFFPVPTPTPGPTHSAAPSRSPGPARSATPSPDSSQTEWYFDLFAQAGIRHQNPDFTACTAASVQTSLNLIALAGGDTTWQPTTDYEKQKEILAYERANMTLPSAILGSDPHGARNALNYFGWGSMEAGVYTDAAYATFATAATQVVRSIARTHKPAIIFTWMGGHAQIVTGYKAHGADPATSDAFTVEGVYITDPVQGTVTLEYDATVHDVVPTPDDSWVSLAAWKSGPDAIQYSRYWQNDSNLRDPIDGNIGRTEWYNRWVVVLPTR